MAKLLIISHTEHYLANGVYHGWGATVREIDHLASLFDSVRHVAPLHDSREMNRNALPYEAPNVVVRPVRPAGGRTVKAKLGILSAIPAYVLALREEMHSADIIHVRCPANISLVALLVLLFSRCEKKMWLKYAGNWSPRTILPLSYSLQRWLLRRIFVKAVVTVNGTGVGDPSHVVPILNPSITDDEVDAGREAAKCKELKPPYRLLTVGRTESEKGIRQALDIVKFMASTDTEVHLDVVGDGPERKSFEACAREMGIAGRVTFHGWLGRNELNRFYERSHILLLMSRSEGWPKVVSEAMAFGCVPVCRDVSSIGYHLKRFGTGCVVDTNSVKDAVRAMREILSDAGEWKRQSTNALDSAVYFTYETYLKHVSTFLGLSRKDLRRSNDTPFSRPLKETADAH